MTQLLGGRWTPWTPPPKAGDQGVCIFGWLQLTQQGLTWGEAGGRCHEQPLGISLRHLPSRIPGKAGTRPALRPNGVEPAGPLLRPAAAAPGGGPSPAQHADPAAHCLLCPVRIRGQPHRSSGREFGLHDVPDGLRGWRRCPYRGNWGIIPVAPADDARGWKWQGRTNGQPGVRPEASARRPRKRGQFFGMLRGSAMQVKHVGGE